MQVQRVLWGPLRADTCLGPVLVMVGHQIASNDARIKVTADAGVVIGPSLRIGGRPCTVVAPSFPCMARFSEGFQSDA